VEAVNYKKICTVLPTTH